MDKFIFAVMLSCVSFAAWANPSHDFRLSPNAQIEGTCRSSEGNERSKLKIKVHGTSTLGLSLKLCSRQYGFRKFSASTSIPSILLDVDRLMDIRPGSSVTSGRMRVTREADSSSGMNFSVSGINPKVSNLLIQIPSQAGWARSVRGGRQMILPWSRIQFSYSHPVAGTFNINGRLSEIQSN